MRKSSAVLLLLVLLAACGDSGVQPLPPIVTPAPSRPPAPTTPPADSAGALKLELEAVASGFDNPTFIANAGDGSGRLFVVEQAGTIRTTDGQLFLDIRERVNDGGNEQGLLGLAFAPDFATSGVFYVNYTATNDDSVTSRFRLTGAGEAGDQQSEEVLLRIEDPAANHNGGMLAFGPDGYLYIGLGDGGAANDQFRNGQNRRTLWGKLLRIDVSAPTGYTVPADNPFSDDATRSEIWALGLRNPWRFSFDRATGDLYIGDVGQNRFEWVHYQPAADSGGHNYGWPIVEGSTCRGNSACDTTGLTLPIAEYSHDGGGCSVIGGYVYRGARYPALVGTYVFADYCLGTIWTTQRAESGWVTTEQLDKDLLITSFGEDEQGEIYVAGQNDGTIYHLTVID
ncbi:MAG: PQQ-dependent sugar dehydrogenase [Herpetosiphonaceae bacterium]|nr:PQQ-dependent sugar dehydrogenase [Herpetosiphonaceae bacterium]